MVLGWTGLNSGEVARSISWSRALEDAAAAGVVDGGGVVRVEVAGGVVAAGVDVADAMVVTAWTKSVSLPKQLPNSRANFLARGEVHFQGPAWREGSRS